MSTRQPDRSDERIREYISRDFARAVAGITVVCGSRAVAEELVQDALAKAWALEMKGGELDSLAAWVATTALNLEKWAQTPSRRGA